MPIRRWKMVLTRKQSQVFFTVILLFMLTHGCSSTRVNYLITASNTIRPGQALSLRVSLHGSSNNSVTLLFNILRNNQVLVATTVEMLLGTTKSLTLPPVPLNSPFGNYELTVRGQDSSGSILFVNATKLSFNPKALLTFVQTDKAIYKPGQTVRLRVIILYPNLRPYDGEVHIAIEGPKKNRIAQWLSDSSESGVVSKTLLLDIEPVLGEWKIQAIIPGSEIITSTLFTVAEYVLPKFEVIINIPTFIVQNEQRGLAGTAVAKYTYGMKVRGEAHVTLSAFVFKPCEPNTECILSTYGQKEVKISNIFPEINGQVDFAFSHREIMKMLQNAFPGRMKVSVEVKEKLTGIVTKAEKWLRFSKERNRLQFVNAPRSFMPGMKYITYVQVTQYDGTPLLPKDRCMAVYVLIKETGAENRASHKNMYLCILDNGIVKISVDVQSDTNIIFIKASLLSQYTSITLFAKRHSPSDSFLQLTSNTLVAKVGKPIKVVVNGKHLPETLSYVVISRGNIIASANISQCCLHLVPRPHWSPSINILVYFVRQDSEVVNDAITLGVEGAFENKVHLTWSTLQAAPGDNVSLHVSASEARAYVGLLVVDKSVLLLKEGNDITKEKVISELSGITNHPVDHTTGMPFLRRWGSDDAASIFEEAGVAVLTNFYIPRSYERRDLMESPRLLGEVAKDGHFQEPSRIRSDFPETWIWEDSLTRANGIASITATVPDTITSWIASAFSVGPRFGLGLASPQELISFLPFFIYLDLPYSIIRGEDFLLKVVVFNYLSQDQQVAVTLKESESFELYSARQIIITVRRKEGASLAFALSPKTLGQVPMTVKAQSAHASDAITDHVLVKAEGKRRTFSKAVLIDRRSGETNVTSEILKFTYPSNMVQGSAVAYVSAVGDIMGPSIEGLQHLVQMPYGCGEQNMVKFAPNVYVLQYLEATDKSFESLRQKVISYMVRGYQRQLNYQRQDGSYSAFGDSDRSGSTWLTAFVFKCFTQASTFMFIDQHQMHRTYIWLVEQWSDDGEFQEAGRLLDAPILGASTNPVALTASVVTSLLSNPDNWDMKVKASIAYLERAVGRGIENHRDLALVTYALVLGKSEDAATALDQLNHHAILDGDVMHWPNQNPTLLHSASSIETAAYALLAHLKLGLIEEGLPIMHWLSQQRSHLGGFVSTQDTVVALEAMSAFAIEMSRGDFNLQLTVYTTVMQNTLSINHENTLLLQKVQIPTVETLGSLTVNVQAKGTGFAILQLNVLYNVKEEMPENEPFELLVNIDDVTGEGSLHYTVHICTRRKSRVNGGMVLLEVGMLSGFSPGDINLQAAIKRVEKKKGKLFIYFNEINETMTCVEILASQSTPIGKVKEANVIISDFYEPSRKTERSYKSNALEEVSICDICGDQCQDCVNT